MFGCNRAVFLVAAASCAAYGPRRIIHAGFDRAAFAFPEHPRALVPAAGAKE